MRFRAILAALLLTSWLTNQSGAETSTARRSSDKHRLSDIPEKKETPDKKQPAEQQPVTPEERQRLVSQVTDDYYQQGLRLMHAGKLVQAKSLFERVLILQPNHVGATSHLAAVNKKLEAAETPPPHVKSTDPKVKLLAKLDAELKEKLEAKNWEGAEVVAKKILAIDPLHPDVKTQLSSIHHNLYRQALSRGIEREKAGDYRAALDAYEIALSHQPDPALTEKINVLQEKISEGNRKRSDGLYRDALAASQEGKFDIARNLCNKALQLNSSNLQAQRMLERLQSR